MPYNLIYYVESKKKQAYGYREHTGSCYMQGVWGGQNA